MIRLRPHHLLCTQGYSGKGYSTEFVQNMSAIVHSLRNVPGTRIRLVFGSDSLCARCPHHTADDLCEAQEKVSRFDRKTVEYFDLHEGEYVYQDLIRAIDTQMTPAMLEDICRGCAWYPVSACKPHEIKRKSLSRLRKGFEAVEKLRFPNSLSLETTLSSESRRKTASCGHIFSSLV